MNISCDPCPGSNWTQANENQGAGVYSLSSIIDFFCFFPIIFWVSWGVGSDLQGIQEALKCGIHYGSGGHGRLE